MRIWVKGYLGLQAALGDQPFVELDAEHVTVRDVLAELARRLGKDLAQILAGPAARGTAAQLVILVNGRHASHLPERLDIALTDGDQVAIFPPMAGG